MARLAAAAAVAAGVAHDTYYASVENHLPEIGMKLACHAMGGGFLTELSVVLRGRVPHGRTGRRVAELLVPRERRAWVRCNWAYAGNYAAGVTVLDSAWPEAARCQDPAGEGGLCRVVFEGDAVVLRTPADRGGGGGGRVIGNLPVKRCRRHWVLFSTGCTYPEHRYPYAGRRLGSAFEYFAV